MRGFLVAGVMGVCGLGASAQTEVVKPSEAQRLGCLVRPQNPPRYPERNKLDRGYGGMRLLLTFSKADAKPKVDVLFNSAREDMQDEVHDYVARYRLPCLKPEDGEVRAVQDFTFQNNDRDPTPIPVDPGEQSPLCVVMPRRAMDYKTGWSRPQAEHLVAEITFKGDGQQPPEVQFTYAKASASLEQTVREWIAEYRMPCRKAGDKPRTIEQRFSMFPDNKRRYGFNRERFSLIEFLSMTREPTKLKAHFDLGTMACPFSVNFVLGGGTLAHQATVPGPVDPNRVGFLRWLETLQLAFKSEEMANDLFGSQLQVDVPCGTLDLQGEAAAG